MSKRGGAQTARRTKSARTFTKYLAVVAGTVALVAASLVFVAPSASAGVDDVCGPLSSGKIDVSGSQPSVTVTAPAGQLISQYCVKAGSIHQDPPNGPVLVTVNPPAQSVTITHPSGKDISHYSLSYVTVYTDSAQVTGGGTYCNAEQKTVDLSWGSGVVTKTSTISKADAYALALAEATTLAANDKAQKTAGMTEGACKGVVTYTDTANVSGSGFFCNAQSQTVTVEWGSGIVTKTSTISKTDAYAKALAEATTLAANDKAQKTTGMTPGTCGGETVYKGEATAGGTLGYCSVDGTDLTIAYSGAGTAESLVSDDDANALAKAVAERNAQADLVAKVPNGATVGACTVINTAVVLPATVPEAVTVPEAGTVPEAEPVAVPAAATVPQAVPAGGGSSSNEGGPSTALLLLVFAATGICLAASARLLATRSR